MRHVAAVLFFVIIEIKLNGVCFFRNVLEVVCLLLCNFEVVVLLEQLLLEYLSLVF